jgi:hypothetical protein
MGCDVMEEKWDRVFDINVAVKVIKHISSGIYRTPGGAIKELISNAFDAKATIVHIDAKNSNFKEIRIWDNGIGMTEKIINRSFELIGASIKVTSPEMFNGNVERPLIGQFGIGMLASAHISHDIEIHTFPKGENYGFQILLDLRPYFEYVNQITSLEKFTYGSIRYRKIPRTSQDNGTTITLKNINTKSDFYTNITKKCKKGPFVKWPKYTFPNEPEDNGDIMESFVKNIDLFNVTTIEQLSGHEKLLWELGMICPVNYLNNGPIENKYLDNDVKSLIDNLKKKIEKLNFKVYFDGIEVRKPLLLPTTKSRTLELDELDSENSTGDIHAHPIHISDRTIKESPILVEGYLFFQPYQLHPEEIRGLYPRLSFVGIDRYDNTLFKAIREGEKPLLRIMMSGEIYIHEGLDNALNIDRSGFIEIDENYQRLHSHITEKIITILKEIEIKKNERQKRRTKIKNKSHQQQMKIELNKILKKIDKSYESYKVSIIDFHDNKPDAIDYVWSVIDHKNQAIYIDKDVDDKNLVVMIIIADHYLGTLPQPENKRQDFSNKLHHLVKSKT